MNTFRERAKKLKPCDPWFGATYEEAPIRAMRDAQFISGDDKLQWLEDVAILVKELDGLPANLQYSQYSL